MKNITVLLLLALPLSLLAKEPKVDIYKRGGVLNGYWTVTQTYTGETEDGYQTYKLECNNPGFNSCKLNRYGGIIDPPDYMDDYNLLYDVMNNLIGIAEAEIDGGNNSGTEDQTLAVDEDGNGTFDVLWTVTITWNNDTTSQDEVCDMSIITNQIPYPF